MDDWTSSARRARIIGAGVTLLALCLCFAGCIGRSSAQTPVPGKQAYGQAMQRLLGQERFQISETLRYARSLLSFRYHLRVRSIARNRLEQERDDHPGITISVGRVTCDGPRRWHCRHVPFPKVGEILNSLLLPTSPQFQSQLRDVTFEAVDTGSSEQITVHARGDFWACPPYAVTCGFAPDWQQQLLRDRYTAQITVDRRTGLPQTWSSWVTPPQGAKDARQTIAFSYAPSFSIRLPQYPAWKCPSWDPPGTWCMKELGA